MNLGRFKERAWLKAAVGAGLAVVCGLLLWWTPLGEPWVNASYDYLFRFGARPVTNGVVVILMDNEGHDHYAQERGQPWDRALHAQLLERLADDGCELTVIDALFRAPRDPVKDAALISAIRRQRHIVLMAEQAHVEHPTLDGAHPTLPADSFLAAAGGKWGVAWLDPDLDSKVRRHWPFPSPGPYPSLPWTAAQLMGANLSEVPEPRWLRYYGADGAWPHLSYRFALTQPANYFKGKMVFIGSHPRTTVPGDEADEFATPYTRWTGQGMGGVQIMITSFLNLMNGDWMRRPPASLEAGLLMLSGVLLGGALCWLRPLVAGLAGLAFAWVVMLAAISWGHHTPYWFPWAIIAGGQMPCAFLWSWAMQKERQPAPTMEVVLAQPAPSPAAEPVVTVSAPASPDRPPNIEDYEISNPPIGSGAYGKVWLVRNAVGQWQALKVVYLSNFNNDPDPYEREFNGIKKYKPISDKHPGLLRVDFVSQKRADGYFYYVMELGDPLDAGWENEPSTYKPRDLFTERARAKGQKIPVRECLAIGLSLTESLQFLHGQGLTHRDIKPQNIIFVNGRPKLADVGLIANIRPDEQKTYVGTPGYIPPPPEQPGTPQADIYALGMMLYVLSTGRNPTFFPEIATTIVQSPNLLEYFVLNPVILKACEPDISKRYAHAAEMHAALLEAQAALDKEQGESPFPPAV